MARDKVIAAIGDAQVARVIHAGGGRLVNIVLRGLAGSGRARAGRLGVTRWSRKSRCPSLPRYIVSVLPWTL